MSSPSASIITAGPLGSTGVAPLHGYYGPLRLPLASPTPILNLGGVCGHEPRRGGSLRFLLFRSVRAITLDPGCPDAPSSLGRRVGNGPLPSPRGGPVTSGVTRLSTGVHLRYGPHLRRRGVEPRRVRGTTDGHRSCFPVSGCPFTTDRGYMSSERLHGGLLSSHEEEQTFPDAPEARRKTEGGAPAAGSSRMPWRCRPPQAPFFCSAPCLRASATSVDERSDCLPLPRTIQVSSSRKSTPRTRSRRSAAAPLIGSAAAPRRRRRSRAAGPPAP